jgi:hypothetical protein
MPKVFGYHEFDLREGADEKEFEEDISKSIAEIKLPGLIDKFFVKGVRGKRRGKYAVIWVFESLEAIESLWGTEDDPKPGPDIFLDYEEKVLGPYIDRPAQQIVWSDYEVIVRESK